MIRQRTVTGRWIDLSRPRAEDFCLEDIATGLSNCCRFSGQVQRFYSVAQHACFVARLAPTRLKLHALHHDDSEAYMGDLSRWLKHHELLAGYRALEAPVQAAIERSLGLMNLDSTDRATIKVCDDVAALYEHIALRMHQQPSQVNVGKLCDEGFVKRPLAEVWPYFEDLQQPFNGERPFTLNPWDARKAKGCFEAAHRMLLRRLQ